MLTIDTTECRIMVTMPHRHGGVASMVAALREAAIQVIRIEPRASHTGVYHLIVSDRQRLAMSILEEIGCQALGCSDDTIGGPLTPRSDGYAVHESAVPR
jgi:hypothetical protein